MSELIVTCEHASDHIPAEMRKRMEIPADIELHRIYDKGALESAKTFASAHGLMVHDFQLSRLLIDANRSLTNRSLFSEFARKLTEKERLNLLREHYIPFRMAVIKEISSMKQAVHLSFHSFTPVMDGKVRGFDIGILYDPKRPQEAETAKRIIKYLSEKTGLTVLGNAPYKGTSDGHTTALRKDFAPDSYIGLEIEFSQRLTTDAMKTAARAMAAFFQ